jgi:hypothetical protein
MFNFLQGGKPVHQRLVVQILAGKEGKGRVFKNLFKQGEKSMKGKNVFAVLLLLGVLVLTGWGCRQERVSPTAPEMKTYRNEEWGVSFTYPIDWQYREYRETVEGKESVTLAFSDQELPETLPPEPLFPITVFREDGTVENAMSDYAEVVSLEDVTLGSRVIKKIIYYSDLLGQNDRVYLIPLRNGFLRMFVPDATNYVPIAENMITTITEIE